MTALRVAIISTNRNKNPVAVMPFGACLVAEAAERAGHRVDLLDLMFERDPRAVLGQFLNRVRPDVVGLSVRNIDNNNMRSPVMFYEELKPLVAVVRAETCAPVVLGGAAVGLMPEEFLRYTGADFAVPGEGTTVFPAFLAAYGSGRDPCTIPGLARLENGRYCVTGSLKPDAARGFPVPDFRRWLRTGTYRSCFSSAPLQTKQGCPFGCVYCTYAISEGKEYRLADPENVVRAVRSLVAQGLRDVEFVDNVFNAPYGHGLEICRRLAAARTGARFQTVELNPRFIDRPLLAAMEEARFSGIGITAESASDAVLEGLGKGYTAREVERAALLVSGARLPVLWMFLLGGPGETAETVLRTIRFAEDYIRPGDIAFFNIGIRVYPGTELERIARRDGVLKASSGEMLRPVTYVSPRVAGEWIMERLRLSVARHHNFVDPQSLGFPYMPGLCRAGHFVGLRQPFWKHVRFLRHARYALSTRIKL